ncbi:small ribosomal subunit protein mS29 isoform X2 [Hydra vulgaris]|uniref:Small ribosomal subunit protein mS29 n=1 Tax=Hydra vulgaris TaxID=6087 RepID=A0ABM4DEP5_HYDVU
MHCNKCRSLNFFLYKNLSSQFFFLYHYSTSSQKLIKEVDDGFTLCNVDPAKHSLKHVSQIYSIPKSIATDALSTAIPKRFDEVSRTIDDYGMLLRKPSLQIIDNLNKNENDVKKYLLYGHDGNGKAMSLLHIIHYCLQNDWIIVHVPNGFRFIDGQTKTIVQPSTWNNTRFDQPIEAANWLNSFSKINYKFLHDLKTTQTYKWGKRETTEEGKPLYEVVSQAAGRNIYATDAVGVLLKEIQNQNKVHVLYAVNGLNAFFGKTSHKYNGKLVEVENLGLVNHFVKLLKDKNKLKKGTYVTSITQTSQFSQKHVDPQNLPKLLSEKGFDFVQDFEKFEIENYNDEEYEIMMNYYKYKHWLTKDLSVKLRGEVQFMSQMNPNLVAKICAAL